MSQESERRSKLFELSEIEMVDRIEAAEDLLKRVARNMEEAPAFDPEWWRDYYLFTGEHMILTDEGWEPGDCKESLMEDEAEILDEINAPA